MNPIARPADSATTLFHRIPNASLPFGAAVAIGPEDCAVVTRNGAILGVAPPGTHALHPQTLPALAQAVVGSMLQLDLWFVRTAPVPGIRLGGPLGRLVDPLTKVPCSVSGFGECSLFVSDAARFVMACEGATLTSPEPVLAWASAQIQRKITSLLAQYVMGGEWVSPSSPSWFNVWSTISPAPRRSRCNGLSIPGA